MSGTEPSFEQGARLALKFRGVAELPGGVSADEIGSRIHIIDGRTSARSVLLWVLDGCGKHT